MTRNPAGGCAACASPAHTISSCESAQAAEIYRGRAQSCTAAANVSRHQAEVAAGRGMHDIAAGHRRMALLRRNDAERWERKAAGIERRLSGAPLPVGRATPRLAR